MYFKIVAPGARPGCGLGRKSGCDLQQRRRLATGHAFFPNLSILKLRSY
ncbi:hypothetical protein GJA_3628 [Janthinobacterium agaricidamnosum NBRC 102515 = DSM 9628]|uniref:Uncharacterized protein n=1 Tax=Janthinobacterium agaricidamnosum NBRC 102515 = DSM 9628 TaxID=1349767 RepID=W0VA57_9BURK|nr:hypothetical protein GJA_3628 [Janthinobacterium agaricidamnosum NBRC 102515 = DSM 9628]